MTQQEQKIIDMECKKYSIADSNSKKLVRELYEISKKDIKNENYFGDISFATTILKMYGSSLVEKALAAYKCQNSNRIKSHGGYIRATLKKIEENEKWLDAKSSKSKNIEKIIELIKTSSCFQLTIKNKEGFELNYQKNIKTGEWLLQGFEKNDI